MTDLRAYPEGIGGAYLDVSSRKCSSERERHLYVVTRFGVHALQDGGALEEPRKLEEAEDAEELEHARALEELPKEHTTAVNKYAGVILKRQDDRTEKAFMDEFPRRSTMLKGMLDMTSRGNQLFK